MCSSSSVGTNIFDSLGGFDGCLNLRRDANVSGKFTVDGKYNAVNHYLILQDVNV